MHAVGSVIAIQDKKFMVCGYRPIEQDDGIGMGYLLLPYPLGFMDTSSFSLVSSDADYPTVFEGFRNEDAEQYDAGLELVRKAGRGVTMDEVRAAVPAVMAELEAELTQTQDEEA